MTRRQGGGRPEGQGKGQGGMESRGPENGQGGSVWSSLSRIQNQLDLQVLAMHEGKPQWQGHPRGR